MIRDLARISHEVERVLETTESVRELVRSLVGKNTAVFLGRHMG